MSKYSRSAGPTYTDATGGPGSLERGIQFQPGKMRTEGPYKDQSKITPGDLGQFFVEDPEFLLRQTVAILDKVIRKPKTLRGLHPQTYADRTFLGVKLWQLLQYNFSEAGLSPDKLKDLQNSWNSKIHPYAEFEFHPTQPLNPRKDKNMAVIEEIKNDTLTREQANGRWHDALWRSDPTGNADYKAIADAIWDHLLTSEVKICSKPGATKYRRGLSGRGGLARERGDSICKSIADPRDDTARGDREKYNEWSDDDARLYFYTDLAQSIYEALAELQLEWQAYHDLSKDEKKSTPKPRFNRELSGAILHQHFGQLRHNLPKSLNIEPDNYKPTQEIWNLHNGVRKFYRDLLASDRLRRAVSAATKEDLSKIMPKDNAKLIRVLNAKKSNGQITDLIRLGRLIVHASRLPNGTQDPQKQFEAQLDYFVSSEGQSEIKRVETFVRVWRNAVGLSHRTLDVWMNAQLPTEDETSTPAQNDDLFGKNRIEEIYDSLSINKFSAQLGIIFGHKSITSATGTQSRSSILTPEDEEHKVALTQGYLWIAQLIRNRTHHFVTRTELVAAITGAMQHIPQPAKDRFAALLHFDQSLKATMLADRLTAIGAGKFLETDQIKTVGHLLAKGQETAGSPTPKYMSVLRRVADLAKNEDVSLPSNLTMLSKLNVEDYAAQKEGANTFRVEFLRLLYSSGFNSWLDDRDKNQASVSKAITATIDAVINRKTAAQEKKKRFYMDVQTWLEDLSDEERSDLEAFSSALSAKSVIDGKTVKNYQPDRIEQSARSNEIERIRQEVFAHLFTEWLKAERLEWVFNTPESPSAEPVRIEPDMIPVAAMSHEPWHGCFYAWLYLISPGEVSHLRHQFKKSAALERKSGTITDQDVIDALDRMDQLMGLYCAVQDAGFDGTEHTQNNRFQSALYEDVDYTDEGSPFADEVTDAEPKKLYEKVFSTDAEDHDVSVAGTRRGLRNISRYGNYDLLKKTFSKHKVTLGEVQSLVDQNHTGMKALFDRRIELHKEIIELSKDKKTDARRLEQKVAEYTDITIETQKYNFDVRGARLTDHARLNGLLMRIIGRLLDYTLIWERDSIYVFYGLLYRQHNGCSITQADNGTVTISFGGQGAKIWDNRGRFKRPDLSPAHVIQVLKPETYSLFQRYFGDASTEHPYDEHQRKISEKENKKTRSPFYKQPRHQIRKDLAHYQVLNKSWQYVAGTGEFNTNRQHKLNLSYLINSVRSLMAYDRKLKNAVSGSIARIMNEEGLFVEWVLRHDRLMDAKVAPMQMGHLQMLPNKMSDKSFAMPKSSVRYTSMVQGLFEFSDDGYRRDEKRRIDGNTYQAVVSFPDSGLWDPELSVPTRAKYEIRFR